MVRDVPAGARVGVQAAEIQTALVLVGLPAQIPSTAHPPLAVRLLEDSHAHRAAEDSSWA
jgi:hypothetical protein